MKIAYLDCPSGISGDMTLGALVDAGVPIESLSAAVESLGLPELRLEARSVVKKGIRATHIVVHYAHEHVHRHLSDIETLIDAGELTDRQKSLAKNIFRRVAQAEAKVHGTTIEKVHFHEVGAADSIADIVGAAVGFDLLGADRVVCSPIPTGHGFVKIAHGRISIPAPATAELLMRIPLAACDIQAELTTPTGAAIVAELADEFGPVPAMRIEAIGCGAGTRDLHEQANVVRLLVGQSTETNAPGSDGLIHERLWQLETNLDDCPGEQIGWAIERLWQAGVLDVYTTPVAMKKQRPAVVLTVLCREEQVETARGIMLRETSTLGVRGVQVDRWSLPREAIEVQTSFGPVQGKVATLPDGNRRFTPEYESCRALAESSGVPIARVYEAAVGAFQ